MVLPCCCVVVKALYVTENADCFIFPLPPPAPVRRSGRRRWPERSSGRWMELWERDVRRTRGRMEAQTQISSPKYIPGMAKNKDTWRIMATKWFVSGINKKWIEKCLNRVSSTYIEVNTGLPRRVTFKSIPIYLHNSRVDVHLFCFYWSICIHT